ncbi:MAG: MarR family transcriptional regulator [Saprospiraceae bacterium]
MQKVLYKTNFPPTFEFDIKLSRFRMFDYCINFKIRTLSRILTATYNRAYAEEKVTISQAGILMYVFMEPGLKMKEFTERHHINKSSLSLEAKLMAQSGWLEPEIKNGLRLSEEGYLKAKRVHKIWKRVNSEVAGKLGEEALGGLDLFSEKVISIMG